MTDQDRESTTGDANADGEISLGLAAQLLGRLEADGDAESAVPIRAPERVGRYEVLEEVGRGGMGVVYRARDPDLDRQVAVKMIAATATASERDVERFQREAQTAAGIQHPNIVPVYEIGDVGGAPFFVMKLLVGGSLAARLASCRPAPRESARLVATLAGAVQRAHESGILHRDLKPQNIVFDETDSPHVTDFGLARSLDRSHSLTSVGHIVGTLAYMAPEQAEGDLVTPLVDVYSLGAILYECLTGRPPFVGTRSGRLLREVLSEEPAAPSRLNVEIPRDLETVCLKCLEKDPGRRYESASALAADLERFIDGVPIEARPASGLDRVIKWSRRRPTAAALALLVTMLLITAPVFAIWYSAEVGRQARDLARRERRFYASRLRHAHDLWREGHVGQVREILETLRPTRDQPDLRDFGWRHLWRSLEIERPRLPRRGSHGSGGLFFTAGEHLVTVDGYGDLALRDVSRREIVAELDLPDLQLSRHVVSSNRRFIARAGVDRLTGLPRVDFVSLEIGGEELSGAVMRSLPGGGVTAVAVAPDGASFALTRGTPRGALELWRAGAWEQSIVTNATRHEAHTLVYLPDGASLLCIDVNGEAVHHDAATLEEIGRVKTHAYIAGNASLSSTGDTFATVWGLGPADFWDVSSRTLRARVYVGSGHFAACVLSPDAAVLALSRSAGGVNSVELWDIVSGSRLRSFKTTPLFVRLSFDESASSLAAASPRGDLRLWNLDRLRDPPRTLADQRYDAIAVTPSGSHIVGLIRKLRLQRVPLERGDDGIRLGEPLELTVPGESGPHKALSPDGRRMAVVRDDGALEIFRARWEPAPTTVLEHGNDDARATRVAFGPGGCRLAVADAEGVVRVLALDRGETWSAAFAVGIGISAPPIMALSPDGELLATSSTEELDVRVFHIDSGELVGRTEDGHTERVAKLAFGPDSSVLATGGFDRVIQLWNIERIGQGTSPDPLTLEGHVDWISGMAFFPDGGTLASLGRTGAVKLWDPATGEEKGTLAGLRIYGRGLAVSTDGDMIATAAGVKDDYGELIAWFGPEITGDKSGDSP